MSALQSLDEDICETLLTELAIRIQLSPSNYRLAQKRIHTLAEWLDRDGSPLAGRVKLIYPQGSMAISATIASCLRRDEFDIDVIFQLDLPAGITPEEGLNLLYQAIKGERGSRYYSMTKRNTRCVTVEYAEMHVDLTPAELISGREPRVSFILHHRPEEPGGHGRRIIANPFGFAEWFNVATPRSVSFEKTFEARSWAMDSLLAKAAETEEVPEQTPAYLKPPAVVALQLIKRYRNVRYEKRQGRRPPGVLLACLVAQTSSGTGRLFDEVLHQARNLHDYFSHHQQDEKLVHVVNPSCPEDVFSDRWPGSLSEQDIFLSDLKMLMTELENLKAEADLETIQNVFSRLFGEEISESLIREFVDRSGRSIAAGSLRSQRTTGRVDLTGSGILTGIASSASASSRTSPRHTFFGSSDSSERSKN